MRPMVRAQALLTPDSGLLGEGVRFALAGGVVGLVYLLTTTLLAYVVGVPFQVALAIGFCLATTIHFTLQRMFVWVHHEEFALPMRRQAPLYLSVAGAQYAVTAASTALLPRALGLPTELVYLATAMLVPAVNFVVLRHAIFHAKV